MAKIGRNAPCPCGSGNKYKRCCGSHRRVDPSWEDPQPPAMFDRRIHDMHAQQVQRQKQQGLGKGIVSALFNEYRMVAVGNTVHWSKNWKTFHDFLRDYLLDKLGREWFSAERAKADDQRHPIVRWLEQAVSDSRRMGTLAGEITTGPMTGAQRAFLNLGYNLYLIAHHAEPNKSAALLKTFVDRLTSERSDDFIGKLFETYAAAAFLKAGFQLEYENEADSNSSHVEFVAAYPQTKRKFSVEVKSRNRARSQDGPMDDVKRLRVASKLNKALAKKAEHTRVVIIEINVADVLTEDTKLAGWPQAALNQVRYAEKEFDPDGDPKASAYVLITNHAFHNNLEAVDTGAGVLGVGFNIPDFGPDVPFNRLKGLLESRARHKEMFALLQSMKTHYEIPSTFDGEIPEFAFERATDMPRLRFGQWYLIPGEDGTETPGRLYEALVNEQEKKVYGVCETRDGRHLIVTAPLSDVEIAAWKQHPETFFGEVRPLPGNPKNWLEMAEWLYATYTNTPSEKLLDFMKGAPDFESLRKLPQEELAIIYCERAAASMDMQKAPDAA